MLKHSLNCLFLFFFPCFIGAQNVDFEKVKDVKGIIKDKLNQTPLDVSGGVSLNTILTGGSQSNPQPFSYVASGNVNLTIYGYKLPFNFTYSNKKFSNTNPSFKFNRTAFNPKYKEWAGHFGDIAMSFSPYTLIGFPFTGGAVEYTPQKFQIQALYGRFFQGIKEDTTNPMKPSFRRMGMGVRTVFKQKERKMGLSVFYAKDNPYSIPLPQKKDNLDIKPMENLTFALETTMPLAKDLAWNVELSTSILTRNLLKRAERDTSENPLSRLLWRRNASTNVYHALKTAFNYTIEKSGTIGLAYERVDPNYQTLGGFFFAHDFENITLNASHRGAVNVNLNTGLQRDDLKNAQKRNTGRMVVSSTVGFKAFEKLDVSLNYSNFQSYTFIRTGFEAINRVNPLDNLDTLNFTQLSQNAGANFNYNIQQDSNKTQSVLLNVNFMESANKQGTVTQTGKGTTFLTSMVNYNIAFAPKDLTIATSVNYAKNIVADTLITTTVGPTLSVVKALFKKALMTTYSLAYNVSKSPMVHNEVVTFNAGASTVLKKVHNLSLNWLTQYRNNKMGVAQSDVTFSVTVGYNFNFQKAFFEKKKDKNLIKN